MNVGAKAGLMRESKNTATQPRFKNEGDEVGVLGIFMFKRPRDPGDGKKGDDPRERMRDHGGRGEDSGAGEHPDHDDGDATPPKAGFQCERQCQNAGDQQHGRQHMHFGQRHHRQQGTQINGMPVPVAEIGHTRRDRILEFGDQGFAGRQIRIVAEFPVRGFGDTFEQRSVLIAQIGSERDALGEQVVVEVGVAIG